MMRRFMFVTAAVLAGSAMFANAAPKDEVTAAAKNLPTPRAIAGRLRPSGRAAHREAAKGRAAEDSAAVPLRARPRRTASPTSP